jgi:TetR/AcrR family fatty acid metabolism transcriptional regulator
MKDAIQEQLATARKNQILEAAAKVFAQKGFHPTTIKDIAREAGLADGTIYIYFENKIALLFGILDRMREAVMLQAEVTPVTQTQVDLRGLIKAYLHYPLLAPKADNFELFRVVISEIMFNQALRELYYQKILEPSILGAEKYFEEWAQQQENPPTNISLTLRVISATILGLILQHIMGDKTLEAHWDELPDFLTDLLLDGITVQKNMDKYNHWVIIEP